MKLGECLTGTHIVICNLPRRFYLPKDEMADRETRPSVEVLGVLTSNSNDYFQEWYGEDLVFFRWGLDIRIEAYLNFRERFKNWEDK